MLRDLILMLKAKKKNKPIEPKKKPEIDDADLELDELNANWMSAVKKKRQEEGYYDKNKKK